MEWLDDRTAFSRRPLRHEAATESSNQSSLFTFGPAQISYKV